MKRILVAYDGCEPARIARSNRSSRSVDFDTVVVGSRGIGPVSRVLQGSVSGHVAIPIHADATVVIAR